MLLVAMLLCVRPPGWGHLQTFRATFLDAEIPSAADLDRATDIAVSKPYWNPRAVDLQARAAVRQLLQDAFEGTRPP